MNFTKIIHLFSKISAPASSRTCINYFVTSVQRRTCGTKQSLSNSFLARTSTKICLPYLLLKRMVHIQSRALQNVAVDMGTDSEIRSAFLLSQDKMIELTLASGHRYKFPWVWMRDNCQCDSCFNSALHSRIIDWKTFDINVKPSYISHDSHTINVSWSDGHKSSFGLPWLLQRSFTPEKQAEYLVGTYQPPKHPWDSADFPNILQRFSFYQVMNNDSDLLAWLEALASYGIAILEDAPLKRDQICHLAQRVGVIKQTHYGTVFEVKAKKGATNLAYLATPLQMHTDLPYYEYKAGVNMLHCIAQASGTGGTNQITDCLNLANQLRRLHPETYRILTTTLVDWSDIGQEDNDKFHSIYRAPVICEDWNGNFRRVNYSQQQRDSHLCVPLNSVQPWYEAHHLFTKLLYHPDNTAYFKTKPGEILTFDNLRIVHGRSAYNDTGHSERHLLGVYVDWDYIYSRIRTLREDVRKRT